MYEAAVEGLKEGKGLIWNNRIQGLGIGLGVVLASSGD